MSINSTCLHGNDTAGCLHPGSGGSVVVITVVLLVVTLLLLVGASVATAVYVKRRRRGKSGVFQLNREAPWKTEKASDEQPQQRAVLHQYTIVGSVAEPGGAPQSPIYENFSSQSPQYMNPMR